MMRMQKLPLIYSDAFKKRVLKAYSDQPTIKKLLDANGYFLGRYLNDSSSTGIHYSTIIQMLDADQADRLLALAKEAKERIDIYNAWDKEVFID